MKTILNPKDLDKLVARIDHIDEKSRPKWGKMSVQQVVPHLHDQFRLSDGRIKAQDISHFASRNILKYLVIYLFSTPKEKVPTLPEIDQLVAGTAPTDLQTDKNNLISELKAFGLKRASSLKAHPFFGQLTKKQWGILAYKHIDHHLNQFGS